VASQLSENTRVVYGSAGAVLGIAFAVRVVGDIGNGDLSWLSPIGWAQQVRPFAGDRWWVLIYLVFFAGLVAVGAYLLVARRDHGAGLLAQKPGRRRAPRSLSSPLGLAVRLQRGGLVGWGVGVALGGLMMGSIASQVGEFVDSPNAREMIMKLGGERGLVDAFLSAEMGIVGLLVSAYGISAAMRLRAEETALRVEPILATRIGRWRWAASHVVVALTGTTLLMVVFGVFGGFAHGAASGDMSRFGPVLGAAVVQVPAAWVLTGITVLVFGLAPAWVMAGWAALVAFLLLGQLGPILELPQWAMDISPFTHTPKLPGGDLSVLPLVSLTLVAAVLIAAGLVGFRRRDIG
jgi:ABC-2 type transport system permease protein